MAVSIDPFEAEHMMHTLVRALPTDKGYYVPKHPIDKEEFVKLYHHSPAWAHIRSTVSGGLAKLGHSTQAMHVWPIETMLDQCGIDEVLSLDYTTLALDYTLDWDAVYYKSDKHKAYAHAYSELSIECTCILYVVGHRLPSITPALVSHFMRHVHPQLVEAVDTSTYGKVVKWDLTSYM